MRLRKSELKDDELVEEFFQNIIDTYDIVGNYAIILAAKEDQTRSFHSPAQSRYEPFHDGCHPGGLRPFP